MSDYALNSDEELFNLVKKNDERAFRTLYQRYGKKIYAYCLRIVGARTTADDVFQTVFTAVYEKRETFIDGSFSAWIFTIARNFSLKARKQQKYALSKSEDLDEYSDYLPDESDRTGDDVFVRDALRAAIASLSEEFRETIELRYFEGLSYDEIAEVLGIGISLAKIRVFRAKQQLQKILTPYITECR